jgi:flavin reductase (DIM6/NTAB) family NADH-FMN oxidoreductase RutF
VTIHSEHPFATPADQRAPLRRLRGQLSSAVSVWTTAVEGGGPGAALPARPGEWAGLTVSSFLVAEGEPGALVGLVDPESDFADLVSQTGRVAVSLLSWSHREVADVHAGLAPSPGGAFRTGRWRATAWGPVLADASAWAAGSLVAGSTRDVGWSRLLQVQVERVHLAADDPADSAAVTDVTSAAPASGDREPLVHRRGRYVRGGVG